MKIEKINWSDDAAQALFPVMGADASFLQSEVERGVSELYRIDDASLMITRVEGDRLIVCCYVGENLKAVAAAIYRAAKKISCTSVQFHTERPGLQKLLSEFNAACVGRYYIYEVSVN